MVLQIKRYGLLTVALILTLFFSNQQVAWQDQAQASEGVGGAAIYRTYIPTATQVLVDNEPPVPPTTTVTPQRGIAATYAYLYPNGHEPFNVTWYYTWSLFPGSWENSDLEFIPMWPCNGSVEYVVGELGVDYDGYILFQNEPDVPDQCTMTIDEAAQHYITIRQALPHAKLIGPQTITPQMGGFAGWTNTWRERVHALTGAYPEVAGYGIHIYPKYLGGKSPAEVLEDFCEALKSWGQVDSHELWVTEFGVDNFDGSPQEVANAVVSMIDLFENPTKECAIDRYAYFTDRRAAKDPSSTTPIIEPGGPHYFDLFWRNSDELSYVGSAFQTAIASD